jgi:hypothetical protein
VGTAPLGAAIFLTGQIFNLHENWATGMLLWAVGAAIGAILLRDWVQTACVALLVPAWLISEWAVSAQRLHGVYGPLSCGRALTALTYLSARFGEQRSYLRRMLVWIGGIALLPCVGIVVVLADRSWWNQRAEVAFSFLLLAWSVAFVAPMALAIVLRGKAAAINGLWAVWAYLLFWAAHWVDRQYYREILATLSLYAWALRD